MSAQLAVVLLPNFDACERIESLRHRFDPLAAVLPAHMTLVFPFEDTLPVSSLRERVVAAVEGQAPFDISVAAPTPEDGGCLFLRVTRGRERILELHDRLYSGRLAAHLSRTHTYDPHVTVGRVDSVEHRAIALADARASLTESSGRVDGVAIFCRENGIGRIESVIPLDATEISI